MRKRGIPRFIGRLILFLLPLCLLLFWVEYRARQLSNSYLIKKQQLESRLGEVRILVFGSSHAYDGINPALFSCPGYNLSNSSQSLFQDSRLCLKYLERMPQLTGVILTISPFTLWFEMADLPDPSRDYFYHHYYGTRHPRLSRRSLNYYSVASLYPRDILLGMLFGSLGQTEFTGDIHPTGWKELPGAVEGGALTDSAGRRRVADHRRFIRSERLEANLRYLEELLNRLDARGIRVALVIPPADSVYRKFSDPHLMEQNRVILRKLASDSGVLLLDYFGDARFGRSDFSDPDHLNRRGAERLSRLLDEEFISGVCRGPSQIPSGMKGTQIRPASGPGPRPSGGAPP